MMSSSTSQTHIRSIEELHKDQRQHEQVAKVIERNLDLIPESSQQFQKMRLEWLTQMMSAQVCSAGLFPELLTTQQIKNLVNQPL